MSKKQTKSKSESKSNDFSHKIIIQLNTTTYENIIKLHNSDTSSSANIASDPVKNKRTNTVKTDGDNFEIIDGFPIKTNVKITSGIATETTLVQEGDSDMSSGLFSKQDKNAMYFLDIKKNKIKSWPIMIDITNNIILPLLTQKPCRNCHSPYTTSPIGCPIEYYPNVPNGSGNTIARCDELDSKKKQIQAFFKKHNFQATDTDYFVTEKLFCSFSCVKSYIISCLSVNPMSSRYCDALSYLTLMFKKINSVEGVPLNIPEAPSIDTLDNYYGPLSIEDYRKSIGVLRYDVTTNIKRPIMFSSSIYIEEVVI
jgi:hypothetical protein